MKVGWARVLAGSLEKQKPAKKNRRREK